MALGKKSKYIARGGVRETIRAKHGRSQVGMVLQQVKNNRGNTFDTDLGLFRQGRKGYVPRLVFGMCIVSSDVQVGLKDLFWFRRTWNTRLAVGTQME